MVLTEHTVNLYTELTELVLILRFITEPFDSVKNLTLLHTSLRSKKSLFQQKRSILATKHAHVRSYFVQQIKKNRCEFKVIPERN